MHMQPWIDNVPLAVQEVITKWGFRTVVEDNVLYAKNERVTVVLADIRFLDALPPASLASTVRDILRPSVKFK